jgi:hypothetical protein
MDADEVVFVDCSSLHAQLYNPVEIGDASTRGQVFQALVWQKMKTEDDGSAAVDVKDDGDATNVDSDGDVDDGDAQEEAGDSGDTSARPRPAAAANFIRSIFNRAPPSPASLRDAWYCCCDDVMYCVNRHMSHVTRHTSHVTRHTSHQERFSCSRHRRWQQTRRCCRRRLVIISEEHQTASTSVSFSRTLARTGMRTPSTITKKPHFATEIILNYFHISSGESNNCQAASQFRLHGRC